MSLVILEDKAAIHAALATMHPVACEATKILAMRFIETPALMTREDLLQSELYGALEAACGNTREYHPTMNPTRYDSFCEHHGYGVLNVSVSIAKYVTGNKERMKKWGKWALRAATLGAGALFGVWLG